MFRLLGDFASPGGSRGRLTILIYHRVLPAPDPLLYDEIDVAMFRDHMDLLASEFNVLALGEASMRLSRGTLPPRAVSVTFDDGYADNHDVALPILKRRGLCATFFVASGYSDGGIMFNDSIIETVRSARNGMHDLSRLGAGRVELNTPLARRAVIDQLIRSIKYRPVPERQAFVDELAAALDVPRADGLMMTAAQIQSLHAAGMEVGAHTVSHPILSTLSDEAAHAEIWGSKRALEDMTGSRVRLFAYPNGKPGSDYTDRDVRIVRDCGYEAAVSTITGSATAASDPFQLPRIGPWDRNPRKLAIRLLMTTARAGAAHA